MSIAQPTPNDFRAALEFAIRRDLGPSERARVRDLTTQALVTIGTAPATARRCVAEWLDETESAMEAEREPAMAHNTDESSRLAAELLYRIRSKS